MAKIITTVLTVFATLSAYAQFYKQVYPIGEDADINGKPVQIAPGKITFEGNPFVRYSFYNNIIRELGNNGTHGFAVYLNYLSPLRMYNVNSLPVQTPTNRLLLSTQHIFRRTADTEDTQQFFAFSFGTGHYSNGQPDCAFAEGIPDGSPQCDSVYQAITNSSNLSGLLNRRSGNFSTNLTKIFVSYRWDRLKNDINHRSSVVEGGLVFYHDKLLYLIPIGGYNDYDIKMYGRYRLHAGYEYMRVFDQEYRRWSGALKLEYIVNPHEWVQPWRTDLRGNIYPFKCIPELGFFISLTFGHDNYNYRFVDSGTALSIGVTWDSFAPIAMRK